LLHLFIGSPPPLGPQVLSRDEIEQLRPPPATSSSPDRSIATMDESDWPLGPSPRRGRPRFLPEIGRSGHWHESTVRRRVEELTASGVLFFDLDVPLDAVGLHSPALLWMNVMPANSPRSAKRLPAAPRSPSLPPPPGPPNLLASLVCPDDHSLYQYLTHEIATLDGITHIETAPVTRLVKLHTTLTAPA